MRGRNAAGVLSSRRFIWKATGIRPSRQRIGLPDWWDALGQSGADPAAYPENEVFRRYFEHRLNHVSGRSGVRR